MTYDDRSSDRKTPRQKKIRLNTAGEQIETNRTSKTGDKTFTVNFEILAEDISLVQKEVCNMIQLENSKT